MTLIDPNVRVPLFFTTSLPYVNAAPHVGHALEFVLADALVRHQRTLGRDVRLQSGTDDFSLKNVRAAALAGVSTRDFVDRQAHEFEALAKALNVRFDDTLRTSRDPRHPPAVHALWRRCEASGDIYRRHYGGWYCVGCEQFYDQSELVDGRCPEHDAPLEWVEELNYFFRLTRHADTLRRLIEEDRLAIHPAVYREEALRQIERGLVDISISRSSQRAHGWGIPVPGDDSQVVYVWFDALTNYVSGLGFPESTEEYRRYHAEGAVVHLIGKGITRFHTLYWPALLLSAGLPLPKTVLVHGYLTIDGRKIGKSSGNAVDPLRLIAAYGTDAVRYYLLAHLHPTRDSDFAEGRLAQAYGTELADQLGNLVHRTLCQVERLPNAAIPLPDGFESIDLELLRASEAGRTAVAEALSRFEPDTALRSIFDIVVRANRYVDAAAPWSLAKTASRSTDVFERDRADARLRTVLFTLCQTLWHVAHLLAPLLPDTAQAISRRLGSASASDPPAPGARVQPGEVLFPQLGDHPRRALEHHGHGPGRREK